MTEYVAYYRVSKDYSEKDKKRKGLKTPGLGLEAQKNIVRHFHPELVMEFTETKSARTIEERPVLREAIQYCLDNGCTLVVARLDRLSRNVDDSRGIVRQLEKKIVFCDIPSQNGETDMFMVTMYAAFAERERELISARTSQAMRHKIATEGSWQKGNANFGTKENTEKSRQALAEKRKSNENLIRASAMIGKLVKENKTPAQIANYLNENQYRTSQGKKFRPIQVTRILTQVNC